MVLGFAWEMNFLRTISRRGRLRKRNISYLILAEKTRFCPSRGRNCIIIFPESNADFCNSIYWSSHGFHIDY